MSMTQGRSNPWSTGQTRRWLVAGDSTHGGGSGFALRRPKGRRRGFAWSWVCAASRGAHERGWGGRSRHRRQPWRSPELGRARGRCYGGRGVACLAPTAPPRPGEHVGVLGWELRRLWPRRREARAAAWFGLRRSNGYNVLTERKGGGFGSVAHGESDEQVGEAGGASKRAGRRGGSPATREG